MLRAVRRDHLDSGTMETLGSTAAILCRGLSDESIYNFISQKNRLFWMNGFSNNN